MKPLLIFLFTFNFLFSNDYNSKIENSKDGNKSLNYILAHSVLIPKTIYTNQVFSVTIKNVLDLGKNIYINYDFINDNNITLSKDFFRTNDEVYIYDTFYFKANKKKFKIPDLNISLFDKKKLIKNKIFKAPYIETITLNAKKNFSNVLADDLSVLSSFSKSYDNEQNIVLVRLKGLNSNMEDFNLTGVNKFGINYLDDTKPISKLYFYAKVNKDLSNISFSYFNVKENKFFDFSIPIIVDKDEVSTQTDISPKENRNTYLKIVFSVLIISILLVIYFIKKKLIYLLLILLILVYILFFNISLTNICVKKDSKVYLLPIKQSTVFYLTKEKTNFIKIGEVDNYIKVKLLDNKIGWVYEENLCKD